jgi:hypothetical protein
LRSCRKTHALRNFCIPKKKATPGVNLRWLA